MPELSIKNESIRIDQLNEDSIQHKSTNPRQALAYAEEALERSRKLGDKKRIAYSLLSKGLVCHRLADYQEGLSSCLSAWDLLIGLKDSYGEARVLNLIGIYHFYLSRYEEALDYYQQGLDVIARINNPILESQIMNNMANIYSELEKPEQALRYYRDALSRLDENEHKETHSALLGNIGREHFTAGRLPLALAYHRRSLRLLKDKTNHSYEAEALNNIGEVYLASDRTEKAHGYFTKSLAMCREQENKYLEISVLRNLGKTFTAESSYQEALPLLEEALAMSGDMQATKLQSDIYQDLSLVHELTGNYKESLACFKEFCRLDKELHTKEIEKQLEGISVQYQLEHARKEAESANLRNTEMQQKTEELEKTHATMQLIGDIGRKATSSLDIEKILRALYRNIHPLMSTNGFGVALYNRRNGVIDYKFFIEEGKKLQLEKRHVSDESSLAAWCIRNQREIFCNDFPSEYHKYRLTLAYGTGSKTAKSMIYCPLTVEGKVVGAITVQSYLTGSYTPYHLSTLKALASYVAIALNNYAHAEETKNKALQLSKEIEKRKQAQDNLQKANSKLEALLTKDVLTDIPNRRSFENFASMQWMQSLAGPTPIAFLMIDIDCFKQYNDTYGHVAGDQCLHRVAQALMQSTRDLNDFIARYGGEEFVVVLPRVRYKEAMQTAERLRRSVEELKLEHKTSSASEFLTISVGVVACVPRSPSGLKKAIALADKALYRSKELGRNRVTGTDLSSPDKGKQ